MKSLGCAVVSLATLLTGLAGSAHAGGNWSIGIGIGIPGGCCHRPYWGCGRGYYYRPYPVYVAPAPVVYAPAPVIVQPAPVVQTYSVPAAPAAPVAPAPPPANETAPPPRPVPTTAPTLQPVARASDPHQDEISRYTQDLADADEGVRLGAVTQLGRLKAASAVDPLAATLAGDRSATVREAAARALGLIGSPKGLAALQRATHVDPDHDVRRSAQFAAEIIQSR